MYENDTLLVSFQLGDVGFLRGNERVDGNLVLHDDSST